MEPFGPFYTPIVFPKVNSKEEYDEAVYRISHKEFEFLLIRLQMMKDSEGRYFGAPGDDYLVHIRDLANRMILNVDKKYIIPKEA